MLGERIPRNDGSLSLCGERVPPAVHLFQEIASMHKSRLGVALKAAVFVRSCEINRILIDEAVVHANIGECLHIGRTALGADKDVVLVAMEK